MEKRKPWQLALILAVVLLTVYNILPTIFYYSKPLKSPIDEKRAESIAEEIATRVDALEDESLDWLKSYTHHLKLETSSITLSKDNPRMIEVVFEKENDADIFRRFLPEAGSMIPFPPAQLALAQKSGDQKGKSVLVERSIGIEISSADRSKLFTFSKKISDNGEIEPFYRDITHDRLFQLGNAVAGISKEANAIQLLSETGSGARDREIVMTLAQDIVDFSKAFGLDSPLTKRYYASFTLGLPGDSTASINKLAARMENLKTTFQSQKERLIEEQNNLQKAGGFLDSDKQQTLELATNQISLLEKGIDTLKKNAALFQTKELPLTKASMQTALTSKRSPNQKALDVEELSLGNNNPFFASIQLDWANDRFLLKTHADVAKMQEEQTNREETKIQQDKLRQLLINEVARIARETDEEMNQSGKEFIIALNNLTNSTSLLALDLGEIAKKQSDILLGQINQLWKPTYSDLVRENYPIWDLESYKKLGAQEKKLGLFIFAPAMSAEGTPGGFRPSSLYVIAKGIRSIFEKHEQFPETDEAKKFLADFEQLQQMLQSNGFVSYSGGSFGISNEYENDIVFELDDYYHSLLQATRENFAVKGSKKYATLEFTDVEQRIVATNKIDSRIHEDLLKARDLYSASLVDLNPVAKYKVAPPTHNAFWANFKLNFKKYFRGDERRVLKWGLDLQGGKTVLMELRDPNNEVVTDPNDLHEAVNQLYGRINKMGVSEQKIRIEGSKILLEFPGSQAFSSTDLLQASTMTFHIVNEKFSPYNTPLADSVDRFLKGVWNEAVVTNRKDAISVNEIAWRHLGGSPEEGTHLLPQSDIARTLYEAGLRLANPNEGGISQVFDDSLSMIAIRRGEDSHSWHGSVHPLMVVFRNYALEGSALSSVESAYDPSQGNILVFNVSSVNSRKGASTNNPQDEFYAWTSHYSEEKIIGTPKESISKGRGWRMAVILNGQVVSDPILKAPLKTGGTITGNFSQREVNKLVADLKAGSLTYTPRILSETNVSPDLGKEERVRGIAGSLLGLVFVIGIMVGVYRFGGIVASIAVLFNLLIMWGVLQNLDAALSLPGIAGIILTVGMAVDANVLVFERIREEFNLSGRIASAIQAGYRKAFSAIVDSNITTILAALIMIQFDAGPIKAFAVNLIIGIVSSMFTALFMTRYFFAGWVQNPKNKTLSMTPLLRETKFNFLGQAKKAISISVAVIVLGLVFLGLDWKTLFGMDFTGGYRLTVEMEENGSLDYRTLAYEALVKQGAASQDVSIKPLNKPNQLRIQLASSMDLPGHPFDGMTESKELLKTQYAYENNPRIQWIVTALNQAHLPIKKSEMERLDQNWSVMSGQFSDAMRNNAIYAISLALISVLIYISFRFEFKYGIAAVIGLLHDLLLTLSAITLLHWVGVPVQIDLEAIGALMTVIGYSLNDTIIVFDRVREDVRLYRKLSFSEVINHALNITLARTIMTSSTTVAVLFALVLFGGSSIFGFSLIMMIGIILGTLSSLFIAPPILLYIHKKEFQKENETQLITN